MSRSITLPGRPNARLASLFTAAGFGFAALALAPAAQAHIRLLEPVARHEITGFDEGIKSCPCGRGTSNRTCDAAANASDPNRSTRVARAEAGSTLTLRFDEYVGHGGTYRVAFDPDGAEIADFNANILVPMVADPQGNTGNVNEGSIWEIDVPLPDMICDNCTLQLVQAMNNDTTNPVADPSSVSSYYTCVDLELVAPGTLGDGDPMDDPDGMDPGDGMDDGMMGPGDMGQGTMGGAVQPTDSNNMVGGMMGSTQGTPGSMNGTNSTNAPGSGFVDPGMGSMSSSSGGGCSLIAARTAAGGGGLVLMLAGLASLLGIRRRNARAI